MHMLMILSILCYSLSHFTLQRLALVATFPHACVCTELHNVLCKQLQLAATLGNTDSTHADVILAPCSLPVADEPSWWHKGKKKHKATKQQPRLRNEFVEEEVTCQTCASMCSVLHTEIRHKLPNMLYLAICKWRLIFSAACISVLIHYAFF